MSEIVKSMEYGRLRDRPGHLIRRLHQIHVGIFLEEFSEFNLTPVQFGVLNILAEGEALEQVAIANRLGIDRNNAADVIRRLERRGFLDRPSSTKDKRAKLARITEEGLKIVQDAFPLMIKAQERLSDPLDEEEYTLLMDPMEKLVMANNAESRTRWRIEPDASSKVKEPQDKG